MSDPINRTSDQSRILFEKLAAVSHGFQADQVINATFNLIINAVRQSCETRDGAERSWDEFTARAKGNLMDCYTSNGRKKGVYPYHQFIRVPFNDFRKK